MDGSDASSKSATASIACRDIMSILKTLVLQLTKNVADVRRLQLVCIGVVVMLRTESDSSSPDAVDTT